MKWKYFNIAAWIVLLVTYCFPFPRYYYNPIKSLVIVYMGYTTLNVVCASVVALGVNIGVTYCFVWLVGSLIRVAKRKLK